MLLGRVVGVHGVRGWVKIHSDTQPRENILSYPVWWLKGPGFDGPGGWQETKLVDSQNTPKNVLALIEGVQDRDVAEKLQGTQIAIPRESLPATDSGEYYWTDLIGCEVFDTNTVRFGKVARLFETGANDVLEIRDERPLGVDEKRPNGPDILVPWVRPDVVVEVDIEAKKIVVDWDPDF